MAVILRAVADTIDLPGDPGVDSVLISSRVGQPCSSSSFASIGHYGPTSRAYPALLTLPTTLLTNTHTKVRGYFFLKYSRNCLLV